MLLVVDIGKALEEDQREDVLLVVSGIDQSPQQHCGAPQVGLQFPLSDPLRARRDHAPNPHFTSSSSSAARDSRAFACAVFRSANACSRVTCSPASVGSTYNGMFRFQPLALMPSSVATAARPGWSVYS